MKKKVLAMALTALLACGFTASAHKTKHDKAPAAQENVKAAPRFNPYEGINLTDAQRAKLDALKPGKQEGHKDGKCESEKCNMKRPDSRQMKAERLAKVKEILTPEQYVQYLENLVLNQPSPMRQRPERNHTPNGQAPQRARKTTQK